MSAPRSLRNPPHRRRTDAAICWFVILVGFFGWLWLCAVIGANR